ncbi:MAG: hypothetical protein ACXVWX_11545, partial [Nocardioides sp.]
PAPTLPRDQVTLNEQRVLDAMPAGTGARIDAIAEASGISIIVVESSLRVLESRGLVTLAGDGWRLTPVALQTPALPVAQA